MSKTKTMALIGGGTLLGRELRDILATGHAAIDLKLIAAEEAEAGALTEHAGEPAMVAGLDAESLRDASAVFLAGSPESSHSVLALELPAAVIDLTGVAEDHPQARLRAPMVEPADFEPATALHIVAHPAAIALALFFNRLHSRYPVRRAVVQIFEPASERGAKGLEELQQQTVNLLSFKALPKAIFDAQLAFNLLARYGDEAPVALEATELRIERHLATLLSHASRAPMPSLRLTQAPVFHGHSFSIWAEFENNPGAAALEEALAAGMIDVRGSDLEPPHIVGVAGQSGIAVGAIALDRNRPSAAWFWVASDNLRLAAENAVQVAQEAP